MFAARLQTYQSNEAIDLFRCEKKALQETSS